MYIFKVEKTIEGKISWNFGIWKCFRQIRTNKRQDMLLVAKSLQNYLSPDSSSFGDRFKRFDFVRNKLTQSH